MDRTVAARPLLILMVAFALAVAGCGSDDSNGGDGGSNEATAAADGEGAGSDEEQVSNLMKEMRELYNRSKGAEFCSHLTSDGRQEIERLQGEVITVPAKDCAGIVTQFSRGVVKGGMQQRVVVIRKVTVNGDRARVVIKGGLAGWRSVVPFRFVRVNGEWKLDDPISGRQRIIRVEASGPPRE